MSSFMAAVLVDGQKDERSWWRDIESLLAPYDEDIEVAEYEETCWYCSGTGVGTYSVEGKTGSRIESMCCKTCGGKGSYMTTSNPRGKWDDMEICSETAPASELSIKLSDDWEFDSLVTPDGEWHEKHFVEKEYLEVPGIFEARRDAWAKELTDISNKYPGHVAMLLHCHC